MAQKYLHGYSSEEQNRLISQNEILAPMIYERIDLSKVRHLLEYGCGVGAQMCICLKKYPELKITGVDISDAQLAKAKQYLASENIDPKRYELLNPQEFSESNDLYDGLLMVWLLEHVVDPLHLLKSVKKSLAKGAYVSITEVYNDTLIVRPKSEALEEVWTKINRFQTDHDGDGNIGKDLGNLLLEAGYSDIELKAYPIVLSELNADFKKVMMRYWGGLMESGVKVLLEHHYISEELWTQAQDDLNKLVERKGSTFYYSFMQAFANV